MKFSELMLDMATGDASMYDAYIAEAVGKINVSHAVFEAAYKISELPEGEDFMIVQEAADAGLPTDQEGSAGLANESVAQELNAFFDLIVATAKKVKQATDKDFKALVGLGKGLGVTVGEGSVESFAQSLGAAVVSGRGKNLKSSVLRGKAGSIELGSRKFLAPMFVKKASKNYAQAMSKFLAAFGISIKGAFDDTVVKKLAGAGADASESGNLHSIDSAICSGNGHMISNDISGGNSYRTNVSGKDIADLVEAVYVARVISNAVVEAAGNKGTKKNVKAFIDGAVSGTSDITNKKGTKVKKSVSATAASIAENIKKTNGAWTNFVNKTIVSGYTDSVYALVEVANGGRAPLPTKADESAE